LFVFRGNRKFISFSELCSQLYGTVLIWFFLCPENLIRVSFQLLSIQLGRNTARASKIFIRQFEIQPVWEKSADFGGSSAKIGGLIKTSCTRHFSNKIQPF
jgi:hypothetical protein